MLIKKRFAIIVTALTLAFASQAFAQGLGPAMDYPTVYGAAAGAVGMGDYPNDTFAAEWDPLDIDYDMQVFAPLDMSSYGGGPKVRNGFFASVDLTYMSYTRPKAFGNTNAANVPVGNDWITGRNFTIGYTNEVGNGWEADYLTTDGSFWSAAINGRTPNGLWTTSRFDRFALNKIFRTNLNQGGYLEPYIGVSYLGVNDNTIQSGVSSRTDFNGTPFDPTDDEILPITATLKQLAENKAVGGQIGTKFFQQHGRWSVTSSMALSGYYNSENSTARTRAFSPEGPTLPEIDGTNQSGGSSNGFVPMVDLGIESSYAITRDISLRMGAELLYLWSGLNRVNTLPIGQNPNLAAIGTGGPVATSDQSATLVGFTFGVEWRR